MLGVPLLTVSEPPKPIPVIFDTDIGGDVDDTWALAFLLRSPELDLRLVVTTGGGREYRGSIVAKMLEIEGRTDVEVALGTGTDEMNDEHKHQLPWVEDYELSSYPGTVSRNGVQRMIDTIRESDETITVITVGVANTVAEALRQAPDIAEKARFVGMFGSVDVGYGEGSPPAPEANVRWGIPAFRETLAAPWQDIVLTPLDTCGFLTLEGDLYAQVRDSSDPLAKAVIENYRAWAPRVSWMTVTYQEERSSVLFDVVAIWLAFSTEWLNMERIGLQVTDEGLTVRGEPDGPTPNVAMSWTDMRAMQREVVRRLTAG